MIDAGDIERRLAGLGRGNKKNSPRYLRWIAAAAAVLALPASYYIDSYVFPVVSPATALVFYSAEPNVTHVRFIFQKYRDCKFVGSSFWVQRNVTSSVALLKSGPPVHYPPGKTGTSIFVLDVPQQEYIDRGMFIVEHRCHWLWTHQRRIF